jgi:hypothetical protein
VWCSHRLMWNGVWCSHVPMRQGGERSFGGVASFCQPNLCGMRASQHLINDLLVKLCNSHLGYRLSAHLSNISTWVTGHTAQINVFLSNISHSHLGYGLSFIFYTSSTWVTALLYLNGRPVVNIAFASWTSRAFLR